MKNKEELDEFRNYTKIVVHGGSFHADDVFSVAYVNYLRRALNMPALKIIRTFSINPTMTEENGYLVADIGKGRFDHHFDEADKKRRLNGNPYASFGLIVKEYHFIFTDDEYALFDHKVVEPIDLHDNTGCGNQLSLVISTFNKKWDSDDPNDYVVGFYKAVEFATAVIDQFVQHIKSLAAAKKIADEAEIFNGCVFLDRKAPIGEFLVDKPVNFMGFNSDRGYQVMAIKNRNGENKKLFPEEYTGVSYPDGTSNSEGMTFCHKDGFLATFINKESAVKFMLQQNWS